MNTTPTKNTFLRIRGKQMAFLLIWIQTPGGLELGQNVDVILIDELEKNVHRNTGCVPRGRLYIMVLERGRCCPCFESRVKASYDDESPDPLANHTPNSTFPVKAAQIRTVGTPYFASIKFSSESVLIALEFCAAQRATE